MKQVQRSMIALVVLVAAGRSASAQSADPALGDAGHVALSADRLFGYSYASKTTSMNGVDRPTVTWNDVSILSNPLGGASIGASYAFPRLAFDGFVAAGFSVGAAVAYFHGTQSRDAAAGVMGAVASESSLNGIVLAPRIGFAAHLSPTVSIWPRAGVTYLKAWGDSSSGGVAGSSSSGSLFAATIELPFAFTITPRVAFMFGPTVDLGLSGSSTSEPPPGSTIKSTTVDNKENDFGVQASLLVVL